MSFGVNKHGFAFSLNGLYPKHIGHGRLPRRIVNRALLSVRTEDELDNMLRTSPVAFGFCINGAFFQQQNYLLNYEIGPNLNIENENYISKCRIINDDTKQTVQNEDECETRLNYLVHYNHYERLNKAIVERESLQSSFTRCQRGQEIGELFTVDDALNLLGDTKYEKYPIFLSINRENARTVTLCTAYFNFHTLELSIYEQNPKENRQPALIYDFANLFK